MVAEPGRWEKVEYLDDERWFWMPQDRMDEENRLVEVKEDEVKLETLPVAVADSKDQVTGMSMSGSQDPEETMMADGVVGIVTVSQMIDDPRVVAIHGARRQGGDLQASGVGVEGRRRCWFTAARSWTRWTMQPSTRRR